jgi:hypothetical protein
VRAEAVRGPSDLEGLQPRGAFGEDERGEFGAPLVGALPQGGESLDGGEEAAEDAEARACFLGGGERGGGLMAC